jgi:hypothetical protein
MAAAPWLRYPVHPSSFDGGTLMLRKPLRIVAICLSAVSSAALAASAPADPCSLLPAAEAGKVLHEDVAAPQGKVAPRPYKDTAQGTDCIYKTGSGRKSIVFRIYFDSTTAQSQELFKRLGAFYGDSTPAAGIGDAAYLDRNHALHARKGNVRFYIELNGVGSDAAAKDKALTKLGAGVAGRL